jgi:hypothetical protein
MSARTGKPSRCGTALTTRQERARCSFGKWWVEGETITNGSKNELMKSIAKNDKITMDALHEMAAKYLSSNAFNWIAELQCR